MWPNLKSQILSKNKIKTIVWIEQLITQARSHIGIITKKQLLEYFFKAFKKLAGVLTTFTPAIKTCKKAYTPPAAKKNPLFLLKRVLYIYYLGRFTKDKAKIKTLLDFVSEVNAMTSTYVGKLDLKI